MSKAHAITLESYSSKLLEYIAGSPQELDGSLKEWVDGFLSELPSRSSILELGSGFGRDALYFQALGFQVAVTDGSKAFVEELQRRGLRAYKLNVLEDALPNSEAVYANAVFLHFTKSEARGCFAKVAHSLSTNGVFAFTLKEGQDEGWTQEKLGAPRYFSYWGESEVTEALKTVGFEKVTITRDVQGSVVWLQIVAKK